MNQYLTPSEIVAQLDKYIIGQANAKRNVAIALRNRWRRLHAQLEMQEDIVPNNILMIGSTGVGKTEIARRLAKIANAPFLKVEASKFTEIGYVGRDVESIVRDLVEQGYTLVKEEKKATVKEVALQRVQERILDILVPTSQQAAKNMDSSNLSQNQETREYFRKKLLAGELDDKLIEITIREQNDGLAGIAFMHEAAAKGLKDMLNSLMPRSSKKRNVTIKEAQQLLLEEESNQLLDMDKLKQEVVEKTEQTGIVFIDEIDKIASGSHRRGGGDVSREGVQRDLLPIIEGSTVPTKYGPVKTDHVLFIAAGAFHVAKPSDLIPELQGRFPIRVELNSLTEEDFYSILTQPKNALTKQYQALFEAENVMLTFEEGALREMAKAAYHLNNEIENIGARRLQTILSLVLSHFLFEVPDKISSGNHISISQAYVQERLAEAGKRKDLNEYIL